MINIREENATMVWMMYHDSKAAGNHSLASGLSIAMHELGLPRCEKCDGAGSIYPTRAICPHCEGKRYQSIMNEGLQA